MNKTMYIASDHAGFELKRFLIQNLSQIKLKDLGTDSQERCDYPDLVHGMVKAMKAEMQLGILICGSAIGVSIVANRYDFIRAAVCWNEEIASLCRLHNDANVICLPSRFIDSKKAEKFVQIFSSTPFQGGRHKQRIHKINP